MINTFNYKGTSVSVEIDFYDQAPQWKRWYTDQYNLKNEYSIVGYPNVWGNQISVTYAYQLIRPFDQQLLQSYQDTYYESNLEAFYRMKLPASMEYGHFAGLQAMNGLLARLPVFGGSKERSQEGLRIFRADGSVYQPVTFDVAVVQPSYDETLVDPAYNGEISIQVTDGIPPFSYQLNEGAVQSDNHFTQLPAGSHKVQVMDSAGSIRYCQITLQNVVRDPSEL